MGSLVSAFSNVMYLGEKISLFSTCAALVCCMIITFVVTLGMGIGLGYNYCFVDMKTKYKYIPAHYIYPGSPRWPGGRSGSRVEDDKLAADDQETLEEAELDNLRKGVVLTKDLEPPLPSTSARNNYVNNTSMNGPENLPVMQYNKQLSSNETESEDIINSIEISALPFISTESSAEASETTTDIEPTETGTINEDTNVTETTTIDTTIEPPQFNDEVIDEPTPEPPDSDDSTSRRVKKLVIPISGLDLVSLLSKMRAENKNYSLQIVTT